MCLKVCRMIQRYDLAEEILHFVDRLGVVDPSLTPEMLVHLAAQLEEDDPLLLTMLDSWDISTTSGETLQRLESFMEEAWIRGLLVVPDGAPSLYESPLIAQAWLSNVWTRPPRGQIDPTKEREAEQLGLDALTETRTSICHGRL